MTWTRLSDSFTQHEQVMPLSDAAFRMHVTALIWCNQQLTDGRVPRFMPVVFAIPHNAARAEELAAELTSAGLWATTDDGWQLDWSDQESAEAVLDRRERGAIKQAKYRERQSRHSAGDHSQCSKDHCPALRATKGQEKAEPSPPRERVDEPTSGTIGKPYPDWLMSNASPPQPDGPTSGLLRPPTPDWVMNPDAPAPADEPTTWLTRKPYPGEEVEEGMTIRYD